MEQLSGAWIFLSHSTKDWETVRSVRNYLEERGHKPLVFFLKCLTEYAELHELIRREIEARNWFLLCDSENAKRSKWVQQEVEYIKQFKDKSYEEIDLAVGVEQQLDRIDRLCKRATIFLSYSIQDKEIAHRVRDSFLQGGFSVWDPHHLDPKAGFANQVQIGINEAARQGFVVYLLSEESSRSAFVQSELEYACSHNANLIPILLTDYNKVKDAMPIAVQYFLGSIACSDFTRGSFEENMAHLIASMKTRRMT